MKKLLVILLLSLLLHAQDKVILTKAQLVCLNQSIDRYIEEEMDPVFVILESSCEKNKKTKFVSNTKGSLPDPDSIPINASKGISFDDIQMFTKKDLECIKKDISKYLDEKSEKIEVLSCS